MVKPASTCCSGASLRWRAAHSPSLFILDIALSDRGCKHIYVAMCDLRGRRITFESLGFQPVFIYSLDWIQGAFTRLGICASYESWARIGDIHCCLSSQFYMRVGSDATSEPPLIHPEEGDGVTQRLLLNIESSQCHVTRVEGKPLRSPTKCMFTYRQAL